MERGPPPRSLSIQGVLNGVLVSGVLGNALFVGVIRSTWLIEAINLVDYVFFVLPFNPLQIVME